MGHLSNLGVSSQLMSTISDCRAKVEQWVEREKEAADEMEKEYLATLSSEQSTIDSLGEDLLALKFKLGISIKEKNGSEARQDGIVQRQENLLEEKQQLQAAISKLKMERETKDGIVKRKFPLSLKFVSSQFLVGNADILANIFVQVWRRKREKSKHVLPKFEPRNNSPKRQRILL